MYSPSEVNAFALWLFIPLNHSPGPSQASQEWNTRKITVTTVPLHLHAQRDGPPSRI